jgi:hypothetical protein
MYFISLRSGNYEVWECTVGTGEAKKLTSFNGPHIGSLRLSPDQKELLFDGVSKGRWIVYRMSLVPGATPQPLICRTSNSVRPSWSHDGRFIYFSSDRTGDWELWRASANGDQEIQITHHGGFESFETHDGKTLFFNKRNQAGLWSRSLGPGGAPSRRVLEIGANGRWSLGRDALYLLTDSPEQRWNFELWRLHLSTGKLSKVLKLDRRTCLPFEPSVSVSYDEKLLAYASQETPQSDIMMIVPPQASKSRQ